MDVKRLLTAARTRWAPIPGRIRIPALVAGLALTASLATSALIAWAWHGQSAAFDQGRVDRYGNALSAQIATLAVEPLIAGDRIRLGVLAQRLIEFPEIASVAIHTIDDRMVAHAGATGGRELLQFSHPIAFEETVAGYVRLSVDADSFRGPGLTQLWLPAVIMLLTSGGLGFALGQHIEARTTARPRAALPVPDAVMGNVAAPARYLLVVNLFNQSQIPPERRGPVLEQVRQRAAAVAALYRGEFTELTGTGYLAVFTSGEESDFCFRVLCAALLCADMLEEMNDGEYRDLEPRMIFRYGLHRTSALGDADDPQDWKRSEAVADAMLLSAVAANGAVAMSGEAFTQLDYAERAQWQPYDNPILETMTTASGDGCALVTDLSEDYRALLDNAAELLLAQPPSTASASTF
jgi:hypothetical protein